MHVIVGLDRGGAELMLQRLILSDPEAMAETTLVSLTSIGTVGEALRRCGVRVCALQMSSALSVPGALYKLVRLIRVHQPEIVQTWMYHADLLGGAASVLAGHQAVVWGVRSTDARLSGYLGTRLVRRLCAFLSRWVPQAIVCAAEASREFHIALGYRPEKMAVVPNGYDFSRLESSPELKETGRSVLGISPDNVVVGSVGRYHYDKDPNNFVRAAGLLSRRFPQARFLAVGRGFEWSNAELAHAIDATGQRDRFVLLGERNDVVMCMAAMDIFCLHSRSEGFPNVLAEAMAMGLACVSTDVGDAALLLGDSGIVVPRENEELLAIGIESLIKASPKDREALGAQAKKRVTTHYSITRSKEMFQSIYRRVSNHRNGSQ